MAKVMSGQFPEIAFQSEQGHSCCGHRVIHDFRVIPNFTYDYTTKKRIITPAWETEEESFRHLQSKILDSLREDAQEYFQDDGFDEGEHPEFCHALVTCTLIKSSNDSYHAFWARLIAFFQTVGWKIDHELVNPKTKNTIAFMSMTL